MQQLRATTKSLTFPPLSVAGCSCIQLSQLGRQWRERKCPIFETVAKGDSNPGSLRVRHSTAELHSKNNSWSVIINTSQDCEEGQHSECYTNTPWGVAILTLRTCYLDLTIRSVALTLLESCFDTLATLSTCRNWTFTGWIGTLHAGLFDNFVRAE